MPIELYYQHLDRAFEPTLEYPMQNGSVDVITFSQGRGTGQTEDQT